MGTYIGLLLFHGLLSLGGNYLSNIQHFTKDTITIIAVGDIMLGTDYPSTTYLPPARNCHPLITAVKDELSNADITFGNLEGTFAGELGTPKKCRDTLHCFVFRMPVEFVDCLVESGFDLVSLANNHSGDFGPEGRMNTMQVLDRAGIGYAGLITNPVAVINVDSLLVGLCAFAPNKGTVSLLDIPNAQNMVRNLKLECDIVMVSFHGGAEGRDHQHVTREKETYLGYDRGNVYDFAHSLIDAGADVVLGHGPHVTRAVEIYKNRFIIYSLGNFCTYGRFNLTGPNGIAPIIKIHLNSKGEFIRGEINAVYQEGKGVTKLDPAGRVIKKIQELTQSDFPEVPVEITDEGIIRYYGK